MEGDEVLDVADSQTDNEILLIDERESEGPVHLGVPGNGARFMLRVTTLECE